MGPPKKSKKIQIISKPSWGSPGRSPGVLGGSWGPVLLEKLVDSMTCKLPPTTRLSFSPVLRRPGPARLVRRSKKVQTPRIMLVSTPRRPFFGQKRTIHSPKLAGHGWRYSQASPSECQKCHSQAQLASPRFKNLATDPQVGPTGLWQTRQCHSISPPVIHRVEVYTVLVLRQPLASASRHPWPRSGHG